MKKIKSQTNSEIISFIKSIYQNQKYIALHEPRFTGNEKKYLKECVDSSFVSTVGKFVQIVENKITNYTGAKYAIATSNGTSALHIALLLAEVGSENEVITQPLTFVATCNAIRYCNANPIFLDVDKDTMGLSPKALKIFLRKNTKIKNKKCINLNTKKVIKACVPMHTYGHPCKIDEIKEICDEHHITLIEDSAESLGSFYKGRHTGTFGELGTISFNGNKVITAGGGGCIITNKKFLAEKAKHLTTTAKIQHKWNYDHDMIGYNYRMPNLNAALLVAQLEKLNEYLKNKRFIAQKYENFFQNLDIKFFKEPQNSKSNYWLNSIIFTNKNKKDKFLKDSNLNGVVTRPVWILMNKLPMFKYHQKGNLINSEWLFERVVNLPSSVQL